MKSTALKENKDFRRLYYRGKSQASPCLVTYVGKNRLGEIRVGITSGKKIGNAVKRNRARRVIRAAFSTLEGRINGSYDIVFVAYENEHKNTLKEKLTHLHKSIVGKDF